MQSIKNFVVTLTLLGVGYGTYVVLNQPIDRRLAQNSDQNWSQQGSDWDDSLSPDQKPLTDQSYDQAALLQPPSVSLDNSPSADNGETLESPSPPTNDTSGTGPALLPAAGKETTDELAREIQSQSAFADYPKTNLAPLTLAPPALASPSAQVDSEANGMPANEFADQTETPGQPRELEPTPEAPAGSAIFASVLSSVQDKLKQNQLADALFTLSVWFQDSTLNDEQQTQCRDLLDQLAGTVIYSREHHLEAPYTVKAGDTLPAIADDLDIPAEMLAKINGIPAPYEVTQGETLKVMRGPFRAEVSLENREMALFLGRYYAGRFPIHVGSDLPVHETVYEIAEKTTQRPFFDKNARKEIAADEPENPYGGYWMGLRGDQITTGHNVGIHGTARTGQQNRRGCIGLNSLDAEDAFSILSLGSKIVVRR